MTVSSHQALRVRRLRPDEVGLLREWALAESWDPGTHDAEVFPVADPEGFLVGELDGEPVASVSIVRYGAGFAFLGLYIVRPEFRGRGFGITVFRAGVDQLGDRNIGLDAVPEQIPNYERSGFRVAHHSMRYTGIGGGGRPDGLLSWHERPFADLIDYDGRCFPGPRAEFLRAWCSAPGTSALAAVDGERITGYGVIRRSADGHRVGPLFADDPSVAERLLAGLASTVPGEPYRVDVPDGTVQPHGAALVSRFGMTESFPTARMYTRGVPPVDPHRVYGITSLELG